MFAEMDFASGGWNRGELCASSDRPKLSVIITSIKVASKIAAFIDAMAASQSFLRLKKYDF
jgi:hypothetical protein